MFLGRSHDCGHCIGSLFSLGRRKKRMKTLGMRKAFCKFGQIFICIHTNVWQNPAYKQAYKCMKKTHTNTHKNVWIKTGIQMYEKNTHTNTHTNIWQKPLYKCMRKIYSYTGVVDSQLQRPGRMGCLAQGNLRCDKEVNCHASSCLPNNPFVELWVGIEPPTLWLLDDHTHHCATANTNTNIKIYEKNTYTNVLKKHAYKHAYKYMKKNMHTNVWQKRVQNRIQM